MIQNQTDRRATARYLPDIGLKNNYRPRQKSEFRIGICKTCAEEWDSRNPACLECVHMWEKKQVAEDAL